MLDNLIFRCVRVNLKPENGIKVQKTCYNLLGSFLTTDCFLLFPLDDACRSMTTWVRKVELAGLSWQTAVRTLTMTLSRTNNPHGDIVTAVDSGSTRAARQEEVWRSRVNTTSVRPC